MKTAFCLLIIAFAANAFAEDAAALVAAIHDRPDDDTPRLVYADWLDDHGHYEQAEFIRKQVELARNDPYDPANAVLQARVDELFEQHRLAWQPPDLPSDVTVTFRRGMPYGLTIHAWAHTSPEDIAKVLREIPTIRSLSLQQRENFSLYALSQHPEIARLEELHLGAANLSQPNRAFVPKLINACQSLHVLRMPDFDHPGDRRPVFESVLPERLEQIRELHCEGGLPMLVDRLKHLEKLTVKSTFPNVPLAETVSKLPHLKELTCENCWVNDAQLKTLLETKNAKNLEKLALPHNELTDTSVEHLAAANLTRLRALDLSNQYVGGVGRTITARSGEILRNSSGFPRLVWLAMNDTNLGQGFVDLAQSPGLVGLQQLEARGSLMTDEGLHALAHSTHLTSLVRLEAPENWDVTRRPLIGSPLARRAVRLILSDPKKEANCRTDYAGLLDRAPHAEAVSAAF